MITDARARGATGWQPLLWQGDCTTGVISDFSDWPRDARRTLTHGAWVDYVPGWLQSADDLFSELQQHVDWRADSRQMYDREVAVPRLTAWFTDANKVHPQVAESRARLDLQYSATADPFVSAGLCLYRDGSDSVAWHGDRVGRGRWADTMVAVLSLGSPRTFLLRPRGGGQALRFSVGHGDLLVMGGSCQRTWEHAVPKTRTHVGPRISVQLRPRGVA